MMTKTNNYFTFKKLGPVKLGLFNQLFRLGQYGLKIKITFDPGIHVDAT